MTDRWTVKNLPDLVFFQEGPGVRNTQYTNYGVKLLNVANLQKGKVILDNTDRYISDEEAYGKYKHFLVDEGDLIIGSSGIKVEYIEDKMGFVGKEQLPLCMNTSTIRFKSLNENILNIRFFMYFLKSVYFKKQISKLITGSAQLNFGPSHLQQIMIPITAIKIQNEIVQTLDLAQSLIDKRHKQIDACDELIKSRFVDMFENMNTFPKMAFKDCTKFIDYRGKTPTLSDDGTIKLINAKSVGKGFFKDVDEYVTQETYDNWMKRGFPKPGDVLFVTEGHTFGNVCRIPEDLKKFAMGQRVITIQGIEGVVNNAFLATYMQFDEFKDVINKYKTGSSAQGIRSKELITIEIPVPMIEKQNQFSTFVQKVDKLKFDLRKSLSEMEDNFDALMQKAFKGEIFSE